MTYSPLPDDLAQPKPATEHTQQAQEQVQQSLNFADRQSFEDAKRGFIACLLYTSPSPRDLSTSRMPSSA